MRAFPILLLVLSTVPAVADPINITDKDGSPAVEASGTSSTTVSAVGGAASVTVQGSGTLNVYTNSGKVSGSGSLGVPELGVSLGGALGNSADPDQPAAGGTEGAVETAAGAPGNVALSASGECVDTLPMFDLDVAAVEGFSALGAVTVITSCASEMMLDADTRDAIADNDVLVAALSASGHEADDVITLDIGAEGDAVLFVTAD